MKKNKNNQKGSKRKSYTKTTRKTKSNKGKYTPAASNNPNRISLKQKLDKIYTSVDLRTTCCGTCECCKVAMPQHNYCEFTQILKEMWEKETKEEKINIICTSIEYYFRNEFEKWGMESMIKPCMLLSDDGKCNYYESRPLNCRMYGLWPEDDYKKRVDSFEKAYDGILTRDQLPLNKQCPFVKRVDDTDPLTTETIDGIESMLNNLDTKMGWSAAQVANRDSYRTLHDWLLYTFFGEEWLSSMTDYLKQAEKEDMVDMVKQLQIAVTEKFLKDMPDMPDMPDITDGDQS